MIYEILDYAKYQQRIASLFKDSNEHQYPLHCQEPLAITRLGYPVEHYTIGEGKNHFVIIGGTHGNELISVDFTTQLMRSLIKGEGIFQDFDLSDFTLHFIPLQNPEGFIINTTAIANYIPDLPAVNLSSPSVAKCPYLQKLEKLCHKYYLAYRQDDALSLVTGSHMAKAHHSIFKSAFPSQITDAALHDSVCQICSSTEFPAGSLIDWRSNGSGIDLNSNTPYNYRALQVYQNDQIVYGHRRSSNVLNYTKGPLGAPCFAKETFTYEPENQGLIDLLTNLYQSGEYCGTLSFHGTAGWIYYQTAPDKLPLENFQPPINLNTINEINQELGVVYSKPSQYHLVTTQTNTGVGDLLRTNFPGSLLIELSKMGGNPLAPYGDITNNFLPTMLDNFAAVKAVLLKAKNLKPQMYTPQEPSLTLQYPE